MNYYFAISRSNKRKKKSSNEIIFKELPKDDPKQRKPCIRLAKEKINWEPTIDLDIGLKKLLSTLKDPRD